MFYAGILAARGRVHLLRLAVVLHVLLLRGRSGSLKQKNHS